MNGCDLGSQNRSAHPNKSSVKRSEKKIIEIRVPKRYSDTVFTAVSFKVANRWGPPPECLDKVGSTGLWNTTQPRKGASARWENRVILSDLRQMEKDKPWMALQRSQTHTDREWRGEPGAGGEGGSAPRDASCKLVSKVSLLAEGRRQPVASVGLQVSIYKAIP